MANEKHLALLRRGVDAWNEWRRENPDVEPDLTEADLRKADLCGADLHRADLYQADLRGANLAHANLVEAGLGQANLDYSRLHWASLDWVELWEADLRGAALVKVDLREADCRAADLRGADLSWADVHRLNLSGADLSGARLIETRFTDIDLSNTKGLDTCDHFGPSIVDHRTLLRSWPLPLKFLRGVGLPDNLIDYLPSLLNQAIQFYSCFISYSSKDDDFAHRLHADLQAKGVRCWFAPEDIKIGARIRDAIDQAIRARDKLLVVLSENSIGSPWVEEEVETALEAERHSADRRTVLFPVRIDDAVLQTDRAWARKLRRERHIGDFTRWKDHDAYRKGFERLVRDLKPELERRPGQGT